MDWFLELNKKIADIISNRTTMEITNAHNLLNDNQFYQVDVEGIKYNIPISKKEEAINLIEKFPGWMGMHIKDFEAEYAEFKIDQTIV